LPRVSIITATFNRSEVLKFAIESVRAQRSLDYEHLIIGDACTDDTAAVVAGYQDPRIRFVNLPLNYGEQSGPNNHGLAFASGELIAYLNHDDLWFADHLEQSTTVLDATGADLVYALPISIDRQGQAFCGATNAELRYDPSHFVPASLWLLRRGLLEELGGWRSSRETDARNPSQDLLFRAWESVRQLRCTACLTALILPSGGRPGAYRLHDDAQHRDLMRRMQEADFREQLAVALAARSARELHDLRTSHSGWKVASSAIFDRILVRLGKHPDTMRNRLARRRKGWWIDHLRELRGLPPNRDRNPR
jgi:hypothetical protein